MTVQHQRVASRLAREVAGRRLEFDSAQLQAAERLDALGAALRTGSTQPKLIDRIRLCRLARGAKRAPRGLYLWGSVGRGKTHLMDLFYESMDCVARERDHFYLLMRNVHAELRNVRDRVRPLDLVAERMAARARLLCLDEFFVSDIADAMILSGLLDGLFRRGVTLVATSNQPPRELYKDGLQRQRFLPAIDLITSRMDVVHVDGPTDYRLRSLERARTYFDSAQPETAAEMARLFGTLSTGAAAGPVSVAIEGREIAASNSAPGLVWFEFRELCETARGANDYLELAHRYRTIFVSNVPQFGRGGDDGARRFLMLIDALYDRGVNIVMSAAAEPEALYPQGRLSFEFRRAASRLIEMQSRQYLAGEHRP